MALSTRRDQLLEAALVGFSRRGYASTSLRDLAEAAGCSKAALYHHFATKDDLLAALADPFVDDVEAIVSSVSLDHGMDEDRVAVIQAYVLALGTHRELAKILLLDSGARSSAVSQRVVEQQRRLVARLAGSRASLRDQVRARCALSILHLMVGELAGVPVHRLRPPLVEAAIDTLLLRNDDPAAPARVARWYKPPFPVTHS